MHLLRPPPHFFFIDHLNSPSLTPAILAVCCQLSNNDNSTTGGFHGSRRENAGTRGVLQEDRRRKSFRAVECAWRPDHAGTQERLPAASVEVRRHPRLHDRSG